MHYWMFFSEEEKNMRIVEVNHVIRMDKKYQNKLKTKVYDCI